MFERLRHATWLLLLALTLVAPLGACANDSTAETGDDENLTQDGSIAFTVLPVTRPAGDKGLKVIRNTKEYVAAFATSPPASLSFNKSWVVSYARGAFSTGGAQSSITKITKKSGALIVEANDVSPGKSCLVPKVVTFPQMTVVINKQPKTPSQTLLLSKDVDDCGSVACGTHTCSGGEVCCDAVCGMCGPAEICTQIGCAPTPEQLPCGNTVCGNGEFCCNESCGICAVEGDACIDLECDFGK